MSDWIKNPTNQVHLAANGRFYALCKAELSTWRVAPCTISIPRLRRGGFWLNATALVISSTKLATAAVNQPSTRFIHQMSPALQFNEGKACDAVVRLLETREHATRQDVRRPECERHPAPIDFACHIGDGLFAFEHTGIEPFAGHLQLEAEAETHFKPIERAVAGKLPPTEWFELHIPLKAMLGRRGAEVRRIQAALVPWIIETAPTLPIARYRRYVTPIKRVDVPGVPFPVSLHRSEAGDFPGFAIRHMASADTESDRLQRIREACERKFPKLAAWKLDHGARTVLILEENDIQLTNHHLVADALSAVEADMIDRPDEIYLVTSAANSTWWALALRIDGRDFYELGQAAAGPWEFDPKTLVDVTTRQRR